MSKHGKHRKAWEVRDSDIHGHGVFAAHKIRRGERIIRYKGEIIDADEASARYDDDSMERHHTFLFGLTSGAFIDGGSKGNAARFINHSCEPNCEAVGVEEDDGDPAKERIVIQALRPIRAGEELTYDYQLETDEPITDEDRALWRCRCGAKSCRGVMLSPG